MQAKPKPPCSEWKVWLGREVEGTSELGVETLFVREFPGVTAETLSPALIARFTFNGRVKRVWFCKEYINWEVIRELGRAFETVCLEVDHRTVECVPRDLRASCTLYFKLPTVLKEGDFVCVGPAFSDEAFKVGDGAKVAPEAYLADKKIL